MTDIKSMEPHHWSEVKRIYEEGLRTGNAANGFRVIGKREKIGQMKGVWRDTVLLERRSKIVGI